MKLIERRCEHSDDSLGDFHRLWSRRELLMILLKSRRVLLPHPPFFDDYTLVNILSEHTTTPRKPGISYLRR